MKCDDPRNEMESRLAVRLDKVLESTVNSDDRRCIARQRSQIIDATIFDWESMIDDIVAFTDFSLRRRVELRLSSQGYDNWPWRIFHVPGVASNRNGPDEAERTAFSWLLKLHLNDATEAGQSRHPGNTRGSDTEANAGRLWSHYLQAQVHATGQILEALQEELPRARAERAIKYCRHKLHNFDQLASDFNNVSLLIDEVSTELIKTEERMGLPMHVCELEALPTVCGVYQLDELLISALSQYGETGAAIAKDVQRKAIKRAENGWVRWADEGDRLPRLLTLTLWHDRISPRLQRNKRWGSPALTSYIYDRVVDATARGARSDSFPTKERELLKLPLADGHVFTPGGALEAITRGQAGLSHKDDKQLLQGIELLGSLNAHRLMRYVARTCWERKVKDPDADFRVLRFTTYAELAEAAGLRGGNDTATHAQALTYIYDAVRIRLPDGSNGRLWMRTEERVRSIKRGRSGGVISITVSPLLLPHLEPLQCHGKRSLIPLVEVPPVVGARFAGQQATLQMLVVRDMREKAIQLYRRGGVEIDPLTWADLAGRAGVPISLLPNVLDCWLGNDGDGHPFLKRAGELWTLADTHAAARDFLIEGGRRSFIGREGGLKARRHKATKQKAH